jgi:hypothetical protein
VVYARRGGFTVQKVRNNKSKIKVLSISMADAGIPTPDPEIESILIKILSYCMSDLILSLLFSLCSLMVFIFVVLFLIFDTTGFP